MAEIRSGKPRATTARQRAGTPPKSPGTGQPAAATITSLGAGAEEPQPGALDPAAMMAQLQQMQQTMQQTMEQMARQQQAAAARALPAGAPGQRPQMDTVDSDPDILGIPGLKPIRISDDDGDGDKPERRVPWFYVGDKQFTVPERVTQALALEYMHLGAVGTDMAMAQAQDFLLTALLGEDDYRELRHSRRLTREHLGWILETANRIAVGALEVPKA